MFYDEQYLDCAYTEVVWLMQNKKHAQFHERAFLFQPCWQLPSPKIMRLSSGAPAKLDSTGVVGEEHQQRIKEIKLQLLRRVEQLLRSKIVEC